MKHSEVIKIFVSSISVTLAFFFGYLYALEQYQVEEEKLLTPEYVDITTSTRSITIKNTPPNLFFRINGEIIQSGSIDLK